MADCAIVVVVSEIKFHQDQDVPLLPVSRKKVSACYDKSFPRIFSPYNLAMMYYVWCDIHEFNCLNFFLLPNSAVIPVKVVSNMHL